MRSAGRAIPPRTACQRTPNDALALPAVASLLLDPVLGVVDTAFVGRIQGEGAAEALGGLAVSTAVFNFSFKVSLF